MKLISHVNADSDLIETWLKYYILLGVDQFHLVLHGPPAENERLLELRYAYPITIEDTYEGPFDSDQKKSRLDTVLARHADQWIVLVDSDEFVEFPYADIPETIKMLSQENSNVMAAPMLQRFKIDGSLDTLPVIDDPFDTFPRCSIDLYYRMGVKGDIFKFPLFFCSNTTRVKEEGNHHPPLGCEPRVTRALGITHHFKFRRPLSERLERRIYSEHQWRNESVQLHEYLASHSNRLPIEGSFLYSREALFQRQLLKKSPFCKEPEQQDVSMPNISNGTHAISLGSLERKKIEEVQEVTPASVRRKIMFVLPKTTEFGGLEKHLFGLLRGIGRATQKPVIICFDREAILDFMEQDLRDATTVRRVPEPRSLAEWFRLIRDIRPDVVVFCYNWFKAFSWQAPLGALLAGVRRRISIQHLMPLPPPPPVAGGSLRDRLRRLIGRRARYMLKTNLTGRVCHATICVSNAVRDSLVKDYEFPPRKTRTIHNGVSTSAFAPSNGLPAAVRTRFDLRGDDFLLVCAARLTESKGLDILIHAVSRVIRQGISCKCVIIGDGPLREKLQREVNELGMTNYIFLDGFQKDIRPYLQAASAFILTSRIEGLPLSILEAMASGLPCIATDVGGSAEAVKNRETGLLITSNSIDEAENAILYLATHPVECAEMGRKSREAAVREFDLEGNVEALKAVVLG
jgi:glycosyltransferase involved in cell wall biosynthesis